MDKWKPNFIDKNEIASRDDKNTKLLMKSSLEKDGQADFHFVKTGIEALLGIKLTNIELAGLRAIIKAVSEEAKENNKKVTTNYGMIFDLVEIQARFLYRFYGISSTEELKKAFPPEIDKDGNEVWPTQMMHEFFQREQAKLHNEL